MVQNVLYDFAECTNLALRKESGSGDTMAGHLARMNEGRGQVRRDVERDGNERFHLPKCHVRLIRPEIDPLNMFSYLLIWDVSNLHEIQDFTCYFYFEKFLS